MRLKRRSDTNLPAATDRVSLSSKRESCVYPYYQLNYNEMHIAKVLATIERPTSKPAGPRSARDEMIDHFIARVNGDRKRAGWPAWPIGRFLRMFKGWKTEELYPLYRRCLAGRQFGSILKLELENRKAKRDETAVWA